MDTEVSKNQGEQADVDPMATLADEKPFGEHMKDVEREASAGEKYYEQARAERNRWVEMSRNELAEAEGLKPENVQKLTNPEIFDYQYRGDRHPEYSPLDEGNVEDMAEFNEYRNEMIGRAKERLQKDENADLDELAKSFYNKEVIDGIAMKLERDEDFSPEEIEFLGDAPKSDDEYFPMRKFLTPEKCFQMHHGFITTLPYKYFLGEKDDYKLPSEWKTVARAQMREITKQGRSLLHNSEEIQSHLEGMAGRREADPFMGETNVDSVTGEARTFTLEDNYPQLEGESDEDWANRLKRIQLKTRLAEKRQ